jgi:hypothetical protein
LESVAISLDLLLSRNLLSMDSMRRQLRWQKIRFKMELKSLILILMMA